MTQAKLQTRSLQRVYGRGLLLSILEKDSILIKVRVFNDGRFTAETVDWNVYWQSVNKLGHKKIEESLSTLHSAWRCHIRSGFSVVQRQQFCHRYFSLLDTEDADLRPQDLIDHVTKYSLSTLTIYDMTKALRLKGNNLYVISSKKVLSPPLTGKRIW
jgi:hypothetical protein